MPKQTSKTATKTEQVAATPVVESVAPVVEKKTKTPKTKTPKVEAAPAPESTPAVETAAPVSTETDAEAPLAEQSVEFLAKLQQLSVAISTLKSEYRALERSGLVKSRLLKRSHPSVSVRLVIVPHLDLSSQPRFLTN